MGWRQAIVAACVLCLVTPWMPDAAQAADTCTGIADTIRSGWADGPIPFGTGPDAVIPVLAAHAGSLVHLADTAKKDVAGVLRQLHATPALVASARERFGTDFGPASIVWLEPGRVGAIEATMGTAHCTYLLFFDASSGEAREIPPPKGLSFDEAEVCWNDAAWLGTVGSVPALMQEEDTEDGSGATLTIALWQDDRWTPPCQVRASFTTVLSVIGSFCAQGVDCGRMQAEALGVAQRLKAGKAGGAPVTLADSASGTALLDQLPTFGSNPLAPYTTFTSRTLVALPGAGTGDFAVIGTGAWGWRDLPGYLVALWHQDDTALRPLASFQLLQQRAKVSSVTIASP